MKLRRPRRSCSSFGIAEEAWPCARSYAWAVSALCTLEPLCTEERQKKASAVQSMIDRDRAQQRSDQAKKRYKKIQLLVLVDYNLTTSTAYRYNSDYVQDYVHDYETTSTTTSATSSRTAY